jgi:hypothetical protein
MTERERWIVYPLLFLALGAALRDKLSEHTKTKSIECQELIVYGEESAGRPSVPLVQIGAAKRSSADSPHMGQIFVNGLIQAQGVQAEGIQADVIQAGSVNADNYYFRREPFAPLLRAIRGVLPADWLRAQQQAAEAAEKDAQTKGAPAESAAEATPPAE